MKKLYLFSIFIFSLTNVQAEDAINLGEILKLRKKYKKACEEYYEALDLQKYWPAELKRIELERSIYIDEESLRDQELHACFHSFGYNVQGNSLVPAREFKIDNSSYDRNMEFFKAEIKRAEDNCTKAGPYVTYKKSELDNAQAEYHAAKKKLKQSLAKQFLMSLQTIHKDDDQF